MGLNLQTLIQILNFKTITELKSGSLDMIKVVNSNFVVQDHDLTQIWMFKIVMNGNKLLLVAGVPA